MRKMKDSGIPWIGQIPEDWALEKLKFCAGLRVEKVAADSSEDLQYVGLEHVEPQSGRLVSDYEPIFDFSGDTVRYYKDDVLFGKLRPYLAKAYKANGVGKCSSEFFVMSPASVSSDFLAFLVLSKGFVDAVNGSTFGVKMPRAEWEFVGNMKIPLPSLHRQKIIASFLANRCGQIDSVIVAKEKTNEALKAYRQSVIYEAVTKGLDPAAPLKDTNIPWIGKIPCSWNVSRLKYLLRSERGAIKAGPFGSSLQAQDMRGSDVKVYNQRTVLDNDFTSGDDYVSFEKYRELLGFRVDSGDLLVTTRGTIGKTAIVPMNFQPGILHPCLIKLKLNEQVVNLKLLSLVFNSTNILLEQLRLASNATTIDVIYTHNLLDILFPLAPVHQQTEILKCLNDKCGQIDAVLAANEAIVKKLREYRQSLIYEAVTGKIACD